MLAAAVGYKLSHCSLNIKVSSELCVHCVVKIEALRFKWRNCWMQLLIYFVQFNFVKSILCKMFTAMSFAMQYWMCTVQVIVHPVQKVQCGSATVHLCNCATVQMQCNAPSHHAAQEISPEPTFSFSWSWWPWWLLLTTWWWWQRWLWI